MWLSLKSLKSGIVSARIARAWRRRESISVVVGTDISERYEFSKELGSGGFGVVYKALAVSSPRRRVAIKKANPSSGAKNKLTLEIRTMKKLNHPNICQMREAFKDGLATYIIMEYCCQGDLMHVMRRSGRALKEGFASTMIRQIASALKHAHGAGVVHRDVKPGNICFAYDDAGKINAKIIDWGIASNRGLEGMKTVCGSPEYIAPEVIDGSGTYTAACDFWSLGATLYVALSLQFPFEGGFKAKLQNMKRGRIRFSAPEWAGVSKDVQKLIRGLLTPDVQKRMNLDAVLAHPWTNHGDEPDRDQMLAKLL